jgi:queuine tRNA-ribosyltransferase
MGEHFRITKSCPDTQARLGELATLHGVVTTPAFLPVGSQGSVKALTPDDLKDLEATMILCNTYHLYLRPGIEVIEKFGGLHRYMAWDKPILTDSGGYQIFSLARLCQVTDEGVTFRSHIDGSEHCLTPESVIVLQERIGADIIMTLDECPAHDEKLTKVREAVARTSRWAERCLKQHQNSEVLLFGIVQGGLFPDLRECSAKDIVSLCFPGYAIGGLSLGEPKGLTWSMVNKTLHFLPGNKPRYLMGVGSPEDVVEGVSRGIDLFDSALPTRVARNGAVFTMWGRRDIKKASYKMTEDPIDNDCDCYACRTFSAAYLHHLFRCEELLAYRLASIHNLRFIVRLTQQVRDAIRKDAFLDFKRDFLSRYQVTNEEIRLAQKQKWLGSPWHHNNTTS